MSPTSKSVIITGGASGIGLGIVHHFSSQNANHHITILDMSTSSFPALQASLSKTYPSTTFTFLTCDVSSWDSISSCFAQIYAQQGRIDIVMANAGISQEGALLDIEPFAEPLKPSLKTIDVNLYGCIYTVKLAIHYMRRNPLPTTFTNSAINGNHTTTLTTTAAACRGQIIATASNAGIYAFPIAPIYASTKSAVINFVRSLAPSLAQHSITLNALAPAVLETNIAPDKALFKSMVLTPMSTLCKGVDEALDGRAGDVLEVHGGNVTRREVYGWVDEDSRRNVEEFSRLGYA